VIRSFTRCRSNEAAASISYYALFSIFPLALALITIGSFFLDRQEVQQYIFNWAGQVFPTAQALLVKNVESVLSLRGPVGLVALGSLLWSATTVFYILTLNVNRAFPDADLHTFVKARLFSLAMVGIMAVLLFASLFFNTLISLASLFEFAPPGFSEYESLFLEFLSIASPVILRFLIFFALYNIVPNTRVDPWASFYGALVVVLLLQIASSAFRWVIQNGFVQYELIYGSLGTIISLMLYVYLVSVIILLGAHLTSAIMRFRSFSRLRNNKS